MNGKHPLFADFEVQMEKSLEVHIQTKLLYLLKQPSCVENINIKDGKFNFGDAIK